jgi:hypothetical protein
MAKSKKMMFRDFAKLPRDKYKYDSLKNIYNSLRFYKDKHDLTQSQIMAMVFCYDLEFFTIDYLTAQLDLNRQFCARMVIYPLVNEGYMYKYFDKLTPSNIAEDHIFRSETKYNYRVRYALSQRGRIVVTDFYRSASGSLPSKH